MKLVGCSEEGFLKKFPSTSIEEIRGKALFVYDDMDMGFIRDEYFNVQAKYGKNVKPLSELDELNLLVALSNGNNIASMQEKKSYTEVAAEEALDTSIEEEQSDVQYTKSTRLGRSKLAFFKKLFYISLIITALAVILLIIILLKDYIKFIK